MSAGAKRPALGHPPLKPKRRKQAVPLRIQSPAPAADDGYRDSPGPAGPRNGTAAHLQPKVEPCEDAPEPWAAALQAKMAGLYKSALGYPHDLPEDALPPFNPLCPPFPMFASAPPPRPLMEPLRIFNPEAYCELCSKEFCNKYFLKTHKANKHGIYESAPSGSAAESLPLEAPFLPFAAAAAKFKGGLVADYAKSYEAALLASQRHKLKIQRMMEEARDLEKAGLEQAANSRPPPEDVRSSSDDNTIPENFIFKGDSRPEEEPFLTPTPRKLSPDSSQRARDSGFHADTLRRLGVINPEAFCKICCKEYCNKYFLKTHKIKRHGLLPSPVEKLPKETSQQGPESFERKDGQTSPLNLIMAEEPQTRRPEPPTTPPPPREAEPPALNNVRPHSSTSAESATLDGKQPGEDTVKSEQAKQSPTTIFISEDLQKLQTMISQLNDLSVNKVVECYVCKKEFDNNYVLQFHMMADHGVAVPGAGDGFSLPASADEPDELAPHKLACTICEKDFPSLQLLKKHIEEFHTPKLNYNDSKPPLDGLPSEKELNQQRERRASMSLTPTNSYCEICNKELCNKYFMKTHMQRMHGIEIENGTQIGGVICDICNKELCSKYFLRVHKHNTHGIVEPGAPLPQLRGAPEPEPFGAPPASPLRPPEPSILSSRFSAHFVEVCPFCSRRFRTSKWLKAHLLSDHGQAGVDKWKELELQYKAQAKLQAAKAGKAAPEPVAAPEPKLLGMFSLNPDMKTYNCSYCPFSTSVLSFLYVHEKSHAQGPEAELACPACPEAFSKPEALQFHVVTAHALPEWQRRSPAAPELFECYECEYKSAEFGAMEEHLRAQHCAVRGGAPGSRAPLYAVPRAPAEEAITMQPFVLEESGAERQFVPSLVFLPVRRRATGAATISFNLTPA